MKWHIIKLGGTSQTKQGYENVKNILNNNNNNDKYVVVVSAVSNVTDLLSLYVQTLDSHCLDLVKLINVNFAKELDIYDSTLDSVLDAKIDNVRLKRYDVDIYKKSEIIGLGETITSLLLYTYLKNNFKVEYISSYDFIHSNKETYKLYQNTGFSGSLEDFMDKFDVTKKDVVVCEGFVASTPKKNKILLGRGGSDTTGAIIANMLDATEYTVFTDVNGIYNIDPKIAPRLENVKYISYELAQEISSMGAKIMHPCSILPCAIKKIPIIIKNTFDINGQFTVIKENSPDMCDNIFFSNQKNITLFKIYSLDMWNAYGFTSDIFRIFEKVGIDVNIITTSQFSIYTTTDEKDELKLQQVYSELSNFYKTDIVHNRNIVSVTSNNIKQYMSRIDFTDIECDIVHIGSNGMTINFVVNGEKSINIIKNLYSSLTIMSDGF